MFILLIVINSLARIVIYIRIFVKSKRKLIIVVILKVNTRKLFKEFLCHIFRLAQMNEFFRLNIHEGGLYLDGYRLWLYLLLLDFILKL